MPCVFCPTTIVNSAARPATIPRLDVDERELDRFLQRVSDLRCFAGTKLWRKRKLYGLGSEARSLDEKHVNKVAGRARRNSRCQYKSRVRFPYI
jgi:hypothetical protein